MGPLTCGFFSVVSTSVLHDLRLVESGCRATETGTTNIEATPWWVNAPTPMLLRVNCVSVLCVCMLSGFHCVRLLVIVWTVAHQASLSMGFSRQEYWSGLPFPSSGDLPDPGIERKSPAASALQGDSLPLSHQGSPISCSFSFTMY